jgi:hypothetical protein
MRRARLGLVALIVILPMAGVAEEPMTERFEAGAEERVGGSSPTR